MSASLKVCGNSVTRRRLRTGASSVIRRGAYFILEVDSAEEIAETLGPEVFDNGYVETYAIAEELERVGQAFGQWAQQGR